MADPIWQWPATLTASAIRAKLVSRTEVVTAHVDHMRAVNPNLNAVVVDLGDQAIKEAKAADARPANGTEHGPLDGLPITVKQNIDVKGLPNPNGVLVMTGLIATTDAPVIRHLKAAGAIIIGQTNTPELSPRAFTDNPLHGLTLNPWDAAITCGGSSGGAGSALAAGIVVLAHGNDIGGSLRWQAHCNGVATIRPTLGRVRARQRDRLPIRSGCSSLPFWRR
jgi:amidase